MNTPKLNSLNPIETFLQKPAENFTKSDIVRFISAQGIEMVNFMYPAADGRLKTLNFVLNDTAYLDTILTLGERVDGSSLFPFISAGSSDLYVIPRYRTAFVDPFAPLPTLTMLCSFFDKDGNQLESSPEFILNRACTEFTRETGLEFQAMGELEFYVISQDPGVFPANDQRGYHESGPFAKFNDFRTRCMNAIAKAGGKIKYGHSEVGNFTLEGKVYEQNEIEFLPVDARQAADQLVLAKWIIRNMAALEGLDVTFAPKITTGKAGSGLHIHMRLVDEQGRNATISNGALSPLARRAIAGILDLAPAITAFGNTNPTSYFRLVPHHEAPTNICWGDRNRSVLIRVPLGWTALGDDTSMAAKVNSVESVGASEIPDAQQKATFEIRSADGSADVYLLLAALAVAARYGLEMPPAQALAMAEKYYVDIDIHRPENAERLASLPTLPVDCAGSADALDARADVFTSKGVFSDSLLAGQAAKLRAFDSEEAHNALSNPDKMLELVRQYFYCG